MAAWFSDQQRLDAARRVFEHLGRKLDVPFTVRLWDGTDVPLGRTGEGGRTVALRGPGVLGAILRRPTLETVFLQYVGGEIDFAEQDLLAGVAAAQQAKKRSRVRLADLRRGFPWRAILPLVLAPDRRIGAGHQIEGRVAAEQRRKATDAALVQFHYDVGNDFYALFLDRRMVYSCAYFRDRSDTLDQAQADKLELICRKLRLREGERFLDIGCGWGALLCHAAGAYGVRAHGVTLSQAQFDYTTARIARLGLQDRVTVALADYATLAGPYDKIASIGMYEHVGIANYRKYFKTIARLLADDGIVLNHGITRRARGNPKNAARLSPGRRLILNYIFPGAELDDIGHTVQVMESCGFEVHDVEGLRAHYARTCRLWYERLAAQRERAIGLVGAERYRIWLAYLAGVVVGFESGPLRVYQTVATKPGGRSALPPIRDDIYERPWGTEAAGRTLVEDVLSAAQES